jgi:uncharacterized integral membrane protein (TIGR00698 family)
VTTTLATTDQADPRRMHRAVPGLALTVVIAVAATGLGHLVPLVGGPVFGVVIGALLAGLMRPDDGLRHGFAFAGKYVLQWAIVLLGTGLSLAQVVRVGRGSLPVMLGTLLVALTGAALFGRLLGVHRDARTLIGVGTGICGASAIAAVTSVVTMAEVDVAYAIGTIFAFNVVGVLLFPALGHLLGLSQHAFGLWSGTAINDTSSVVAAAYAYGPVAGSYGVVVKLTRSLMIIPITVALSALSARRASTDGGKRGPFPWRRVLPLFMVGFVAASALDTVGVIPVGWHAGLASVGTFLITVALAGIGLSTHLGTLRRVGARPLLLGAVLWLAVGTASLLLQSATGTL